MFGIVFRWRPLFKEVLWICRKLTVPPCLFYRVFCWYAGPKIYVIFILDVTPACLSRIDSAIAISVGCFPISCVLTDGVWFAVVFVSGILVRYKVVAGKL